VERAIFPGTFDPVTLGHLDIVRRGRGIFDRILVAVARQREKQVLFSVEERVAMIQEATADLSGIEVESFEGMLVDFARARNARAVIRGLRVISDFEYEFQMALMNRHLEPTLETVFMMPAEQYTYLSSRLIKEVFSLGGDVRGLVPSAVEKAMHEKKAVKT
jgi:pantetheine-phosphate adenylyltransferase